ncbi:glycosyltransferase family A protein [Pedobacter sp. V48]|uniref:glycosyltransferase family A protein n=1 Tax=Pedobacter sp. V48 TaxID=509635 RepID=UPI0003E47982|nr:glycosyltransferase family 2 protein [Pedobacter sp. V48]ETZ24549.1 hypothetical protein N824_13605 [Pedobacter sp. V48]
MKEQFKFAIIIPLFNKEAYIEETINSVKLQTYKDWQLIIVDDNSTDNSYEIASSCLDGDDANKFKLIRRSEYSENKRGGSVCRNIGINQSNAQYLLFLDADDILLPFCLEQRVKYVDTNPGSDMFIFNVAYCKGEKKEVVAKQRPKYLYMLRYLLAVNKRDFFLNEFLKTNIPWHTSGPVWNTDFIKLLGGFNEDFERLQDPEIHTRALMQNKINIEYLMNKTAFDTLHRTDEDRIVWDEMIFYRNRINAIRKYLNYFSDSLIREDKKKAVKKLRGYLILAETMYYRSIRDSKDIKRIEIFRSLTEEVYNVNHIEMINTTSFKRFINLFKSSMSSAILVKFKLPGVLLLTYKRSI